MGSSEEQEVGQGPTKRARGEGTRPARRALSCTECKRRKTKCSALGKTPCDSCVRRGRPEHCYWEDGPEPASYALASDVAALRAEVAELRAAFQRGSPPSDSSRAESSPYGGARGHHGASLQSTPSSKNGPPRPHRAKSGLEVTLMSLEERIVGPQPGSRPLKAAGYDDSCQRSRLMFDAAKAMLPPPATAAQLLDEFFGGPMHYGWRVVDETTFRESHREFEKRGTDASFLALYLIILAIAVKHTPNAATLFPTYSSEDLRILPTALYQSSLNALEAAEYLAVPQIRHIQCAILYVVLLFYFGDDDDTIKRQNIVLRHVDSAVSTLLWLDLDNLESEAELPMDDSALQGLSPKAAFELCKQLTHQLIFLETSIPRRRGLWRLTNVSTPLPGNYRSWSEVDHPERPYHELTPSTHARAGSAMSDTIRTHQGRPGDLTYDEVQAYDRDMRAVLAQIPPVQSLTTGWMVNGLVSSLNNRLLRAHRPFFMLAITDPAYEGSRRTCVDCARRIVESQLLFNAQPSLRPRFADKWVLGAIVVLAKDYVLGNIDSRTSLLQAADVFATVEGRRGRECRRALDALVAAADAKAGQHLTEAEVTQFLEHVRAGLAADASDGLTPQRAMDMLFPAMEEFDFSILEGVLGPSKPGMG